MPETSLRTTGSRVMESGLSWCGPTRTTMKRQGQSLHGYLIRGSLEVLPHELQVLVEGRRVSLTHTEMRLLLSLIEASGRPLSRTELARQVWGVSATSEARRVDVGVARLRRKLERDPSRPQYLRTIRGVGYVIQI